MCVDQKYRREFTDSNAALSYLLPGVVVVFDRGPYEHWALVIDVTDGEPYLIHYSGNEGRMSGAIVRNSLGQGSKAEIRRDVFRHVASSGAKKIIVFDCENLECRARAIGRATERLGEKTYSLIWSNCEHFVRWCVSGISESGQVKLSVAVVTAGFVSVALTAVAAVVGLVLRSTDDHKEEPEKR